jgi:hypothetical protein
MNLRDIDANTIAAGNQNFSFIKGQPFHHKAGELHLLNKVGFALLEADVNGDGIADFQIKVVGDHPVLGDIVR